MQRRRRDQAPAKAKVKTRTRPRPHSPLSSSSPRDWSASVPPLPPSSSTQLLIYLSLYSLKMDRSKRPCWRAGTATRSSRTWHGSPNAICSRMHPSLCRNSTRRGRRERAGCLAKNGEREGVGIAAMTITAFGQCEAQFVFAGAWRAHGWQCGISSKYKILLMKNLLLATPYLTTSSWWDAIHSLCFKHYLPLFINHLHSSFFQGSGKIVGSHILHDFPFYKSKPGTPGTQAYSTKPHLYYKHLSVHSSPSQASARTQKRKFRGWMQSFSPAESIRFPSFSKLRMCNERVAQRISKRKFS